MKRIVIIILFVIALAGCQEVFVPDIEEMEPVIVIEGMLTSLPEIHEVKISKTRSFSERPYYPHVTDALVEIRDEDGNIIPFQHHNYGVYRSDTNNLYKAELGKTYVLRVVTSEGDVYESSPQTVLESPEISNLVCRFDQSVILTDNSNGDVFEIKKGGIEIIGETQGILPARNYYFYRWNAYEQHVTVLATLGVPPSYYYIYRHKRILGKYRNVIRTGNADEYANFKIKNHKIIFVTTEDMSNYIQPFPDTSFSVLENWFYGLIFKLEQFSISDNAYSFWRDAELQLEAEGRLFDPVASQLKGNIKCVSDSTKAVIGVFNASHVSEKYAFFYIDYLNRTSSMDIDSFPQLYLDTCHWGMPDDWIDRPY